MTPTEWLKRNANQLATEFERLFVENVLSRVPDFDFQALIAQMPFKDWWWRRQRFCDFAIKEPPDIRIAIEIDGWDKTGTGTGMTKSEFQNWERRQASLTSLGWRVLRFANVDVRDRPGKCVEHVSLLLRKERKKAQHYDLLRKSKEALEKQLQEAEKTAIEFQAKLRDTRVGEAQKWEGKVRREKEIANAEINTLKNELTAVRHQLDLVSETRELDASEKRRLDELDAAMKKIVILEEEVSMMKTTIWAFTSLIGLIIVVLIFQMQGPAVQPQIQPPIQQGQSAPRQVQSETQHAPPSEQSIQPTAPQVRPESKHPQIGSSCEAPRGWQEAKNYIGQTVAFSGVVFSVTSKPSANGSPTWIAIGAPYPDPGRLDLLIWGRNLNRFGGAVTNWLVGKTLCAIGNVQTFEGKVQIELDQPEQLVIP